MSGFPILTSDSTAERVTASRSITTSAVIEVRELRKSFKHVDAVRGISFDVHQGTTTALLGGNGAGKTTTLSMLLGVLTPTGGLDSHPRREYAAPSLSSVAAHQFYLALC